jgi:diadenosine tetraphosphate (Ap4A) HIT family hydrolase
VSAVASHGSRGVVLVTFSGLTGERVWTQAMTAGPPSSNAQNIKVAPASFAVIGDVQWLPGYCVLLADDPAVTRLTDLPRSRRHEFLDSMDRLGEAVELACFATDAAFRRINVEILGNTDDFLHAHLWPRYDWEPPDLG